MLEVGRDPVVLLHEGGFEGFLTAVFEAVRLRLPVVAVEAASRHVPGLLESTREVATDMDAARRVWKGIESKGGDKVAGMVHGAFLSELPGIQTDLWHYLRKFFAAQSGLQGRNLLDEHVHAVYAAAQKTAHEAHQFQGFVRFSKASDGTLFAVVAPDHDILQLLAPHFLARYPRETWMIADARRGRCLMARDGVTQIVPCDPARLPRDAGASQALADPADRRFQDLWLAYHEATTIQERRNLRQMTRLLPRKYWRYLPERQGSAGLDPRMAVRRG